MTNVNIGLFGRRYTSALDVFCVYQNMEFHYLKSKNKNKTKVHFSDWASGTLLFKTIFTFSTNDWSI
jgi:hypothetical protein